MNILHVLNAGSHPFHYCEMLRKMDIEAELFSPEYGLKSHPLWEIIDTDVKEVQEESNYEYYPKGWIDANRERVPKWVDLLPQEGVDGDPRENFTSPSLNLKISRSLRGKDPDVVHAWSLYGAVWAYLSGHKYVYHNTGSYDWNTVRRMDPSIKKFLFRPVVNRAIQNAEYVLSESRQARKISEAYPGLTVKSPKHVIDTEYFCPKDEEAPYDVGSSDMLLFMGSRQFWEGKHNDYLFKALAEADLPDFELVCVDWGTDIDRARDLVKELGMSKKVTFVPMMSRPRLRRMINASDVVFDAFERGFGTFATQTLSCGKPLVSAFSFDDDMIGGDGFGYSGMSEPPILQAYSPEDIREHLEGMVDPEMREEMGQRSREWIKNNYWWEDGIREYIDIYEGIIN